LLGPLAFGKVITVYQACLSGSAARAAPLFDRVAV
jgi:hypothetical protein